MEVKSLFFFLHVGLLTLGQGKITNEVFNHYGIQKLLATGIMKEYYVG
jgi:hypothetical protein